MYCDKDFSDLPEMRPYIRSADEKAQIDRKAAQVILTTAHALEGFRVVETLEIISSECVFGISIILDALLVASGTAVTVEKVSE